MTTPNHIERSSDESRAALLVTRAWIAVALLPVFFFLAFFVGYVLYDVMGYAPENADAPLWVDLVCTIPTLAVFLVPCTAATYYGSRANRVGERRGLVPLVIGALAGLLITIISVVGLAG